jgi:hypothetical protein
MHHFDAEETMQRLGFVESKIVPKCEYFGGGLCKALCWTSQPSPEGMPNTIAHVRYVKLFQKLFFMYWQNVPMQTYFGQQQETF